MSKYNEVVANLVNMFNEVCQVQFSDLGMDSKTDLTTKMCDDILDYCFDNLPHTKDFNIYFIKKQINTYVFFDETDPLKTEALFKKWMEIPLEISPVVIPLSIFRHMLRIKKVSLNIKEMRNWKEFSNRYAEIVL